MSHAVQPEKTNTPSSAAFWTVLIFVGLIVGGVNFVKVMGSDSGHGGGHGAPTEHGAAAGHEEHNDHKEGHEGHETPAAHTEGHETPAAENHDSSKGHEGVEHTAPEAQQPAKEEAHH